MRTIIVGCLGLFVVTPAVAQVDRYELGARLRRFEQGWEQATARGDDAARRRALPHVESAVRTFFTMQAPKAAEHLDAAWLAVTRPDPSPADRFLASLSARPEQRLLAPGEPLRVELRQAYAAPRPAAPLSVRSTVTHGSGGSVTQEGPVGAIPGAITLDGLEGPRTTLQVRFALADVAGVDWVPQHLAVAADVDGRLAALEAVRPAAGAARLSFAAWRELLGDLRRPGGSLETEYHPDELLADAERLAAETRSSSRPALATRPGQHWLRLPAGARTAALRVWRPAGRGPFPLVLACHGAGGSENMFFDTYGAGKIVELCRARGWLLVAPRLGMLGGPALPDLVEAVAEVFPVDRARVFAVGHSMGAAHTLRGVNQDPRPFTAVAILGGGGRVQASGLSELPFFVAAGERDFGGPGARKAAAALRELGARVDERTYPDAEHLLVVQDALPDVFEFFADAAPEQPTQEAPAPTPKKRYFK